MNRRPGPGPSPRNTPMAGVSVEAVLEDKVEHLEQTLKTFRAEVDLKMTIIEQILTTRNEQFFVQKKLLEREHALYESVMTHWKNTANLAASGLSIKFSEGGVDLDLVDFGQDGSSSAKRSAAAARRGRKKRLKTQYETRIGGESDHDGDESYSEGGFGVGVGDEVQYIQAPATGGMGHREGVEDDDNDEDSDSAERKVFIEYFSPEADPRIGDRSSNPIWKHYMREENGKSALCKICDDQGIQRILKLQDGSTSTLHRHLRFKHKEMVDIKPQMNAHGQVQNDGNSTSFGELSVIPPRLSVDGSRRTQSPIWNYFTKFKEGDLNKARCNVCFKEGTLTIQKISDGSTSRFHAHLKRAHRIDTKVTPNPPPPQDIELGEEVIGHLEGVVEFSEVEVHPADGMEGIDKQQFIQEQD